MIKNSNIENHIFSISSETEFTGVALEVFKFQYQNNILYRNFVDTLHLSPEKVNSIDQIPFLPIEFFKTKEVICGEKEDRDVLFTSSATTGSVVSKHFVKDILMYEKSFSKGFHLFYKDPKAYCVLALLPNYLERKGSSLVYMADYLIKHSTHRLSGFFLNDMGKLKETIEILKAEKQKTILLGVTYALLDLAEMHVELNDSFIVMETGGMKGRRKELVKEEFYHILKQSLKVSKIHSEYGMTELLSQAYSNSEGKFQTPPWMKVLIRDTNDPFQYLPPFRTGGINVIDLANLYSCSFISTKDLGKQLTENKFEVLGRFDNSDIRGCNLMMD